MKGYAMAGSIYKNYALGGSVFLLCATLWRKGDIAPKTVREHYKTQSNEKEGIAERCEDFTYRRYAHIEAPRRRCKKT